MDTLNSRRQPLMSPIGCALFADAGGFSLDNCRAQPIWVPAQGEDMRCRFTALAPGRYAVAVAHDGNGNRRVDTNFVGLPTEQWGILQNACPTLRAPRFDAAVFTIAAKAGDVAIEIQVGK